MCYRYGRKYDLYNVWRIGEKNIRSNCSSVWRWRINILRVGWMFELVGILFIEKWCRFWIIGWDLCYMFIWDDCRFFRNYEGRRSICFNWFSVFGKLIVIYFRGYLNKGIGDIGKVIIKNGYI